MDVHNNMKGIDEKSLREAHAMDLKIEDDENVHFLHAWADPKSGKVFCLAEAPSREAVIRVHEKAGHPADEVYEVSLEVE